MDFTEAEDTKKRWQEYTEELYKKELHDPDNHNGVITLLEPDPGMWSQVGLGSVTMNKTSGGDGIPVELFQILKDDAVKVLHSICQQIWNSEVGIGLEKVGFHSNAKECSNYCTIALISYTSKVMLKIVQARLQQYMNHELPDGQAGFRKGRGTGDQITNTETGSSKKQESSRKTSISALLTMPKPLTVWITTKCGKFFKRWEYQATLPVSWEMCMQVKKQ